MKKLLFVLPVVAGLLFVGCDTTPDYAPLAVGDVWNYSGYSTMTTTTLSTDTTATVDQRVEVTKSDTLNSGIAVVEVVTTVTQELSVPDTTVTTVDTSYYQETDSSVVVYPDKSSTSGEVVLVLPLEAGKSWTKNGSTTTVTEQEDVTVPAKTYKNAWRFDVTNPAYPDMESHSWYANNVGQVKTEWSNTSGGYTMHTVMELTSATIK